VSGSVVNEEETMKIVPFALGVALMTAAFTVPAPAADSSQADGEREARWQLIAQHIFGEREIQPTDSLITLDVPKRAQDAALVPVTLTISEKDTIKSVYLVIDDNPSPLAAHVTFGPAADPGSLQLRVRIDTYTNVHAVAETTDGQLFATTAFVKASGGCSAPIGRNDEQAMAGMGEMRVKFADGVASGEPAAATLMIRHPNFSGMQMNQLTRLYTPARYIDKVTVSYGDAKIFDLEGDISLSSDPVIGFSFVPHGDGPIRVVASDTKNGRWEQTFEAPAGTN
jgi:sulfur-oxidizing protein SoxY